ERFLFEAEQAAGPLDTPERRAAFKARLKALAGEIADPDVRRDYLSTWLGRADALFRPARQPRQPFGPPQPFEPRQPFQPGGRRAGWQPPIPPARPETRAAAGAPTEIHVGMLLRLLSTDRALAERHAEALVELQLRSPALSLARDHLLAGTPAGQLLSGYRALSFGETDAAALSQEIARTLASCLASHHIAGSERQAFDPGSDIDWEEALERNRAAAQPYLDRAGMKPAIHDDSDRA
ncbi:MAG: hypothetical protein ACRC1J_08435, partial [Sandaracinobacteroides sp.]